MSLHRYDYIVQCGERPVVDRLLGLRLLVGSHDVQVRTRHDPGAVLLVVEVSLTKEEGVINAKDVSLEQSIVLGRALTGLPLILLALVILIAEHELLFDSVALFKVLFGSTNDESIKILWI